MYELQYTTKIQFSKKPNPEWYKAHFDDYVGDCWQSWSWDGYDLDILYKKFTEHIGTPKIYQENFVKLENFYDVTDYFFANDSVEIVFRIMKISNSNHRSVYLPFEASCD